MRIAKQAAINGTRIGEGVSKLTLGTQVITVQVFKVQKSLNRAKEVKKNNDGNKSYQKRRLSNNCR
jgi:hypothetical protein